MAAAIILRIVIWFSWVFFILLNLSSAKYLPHHDDNGALPVSHGLAMPVILILMSVLVAGGLRWWISRIRTLSLRLFPIWLGLISASFTQCFGIYLEPNHELLFQILSDFILLAYYPLFLTDRWSRRPAVPPPIPGR